jgi:hypothetical protein
VSYSIAVLSVVRWNLIALLTHRFGERFERMRPVKAALPNEACC